MYKTGFAAEAGDGIEAQIKVSHTLGWKTIDVRRIAGDLLANGCDGGFSMEPHLAVVHHAAAQQSPGDMRFANYVEYGRRFMRLVDDVKPKG